MTGKVPSALSSFASLDAFARVLAEVVGEASLIALRYFRDGCLVSSKDDGSPVTTADLESQRFIVEKLQGCAPDLPICAEEDERQQIGASHEAYLLVDPLDGTKEFVKGSTEWTVNVGLVVEGRAVAGAVCVPADGTLFWGGTRAIRALYRDRRIEAEQGIAVHIPPAHGLRGLCSRDHKGENVEVLFRRLGVTDIVAAGSSIKMLRIASGEADIYPRLGPTMAWDTAAAHAVLSAAGGELFRCDGSILTYDPRQVANPSFIAYGAKVLPPAVIVAARDL